MPHQTVWALPSFPFLGTPQILWNKTTYHHTEGTDLVGTAVFLMDSGAENRGGGGGGDPTLTLDLSISAVVEWLAFRDWGSVWSWSVKTYTPTERRKMKDIFSFSSTFPKVSGVHIGSKLQHLKHALWVSSESLCSFGFLRLYSPQGKISGVTYKWRFSAGFESWQHRTIFHF